MGWSKGKFVDEAFSSFGLSKMNYTITDEQRADGIAFLDSMMADWEQTKEMYLGYVRGGNANTDTGLPDHANNAVTLNLALYCAQGIGKDISPVRANNARDSLLSWCVRNNIPQMQNRRDMPRGQGNKPYRIGTGQYYYPADRLATGAGSFVDDGQGGQLVTGNNLDTIQKA